MKKLLTAFLLTLSMLNSASAKDVCVDKKLIAEAFYGNFLALSARNLMKHDYTKLYREMYQEIQDATERACHKRLEPANVVLEVYRACDDLCENQSKRYSSHHLLGRVRIEKEILKECKMICTTTTQSIWQMNI